MWGTRGSAPFPRVLRRSALRVWEALGACAKPMDTAQSETEMRVAGQARKAHVAANM